MKIGIIFCHVKRVKILKLLKYFPIFKIQKWIGNRAIFIIIANMIINFWLNLKKLVLLILYIDKYIKNIIVAIDWMIKYKRNFSEFIIVDDENNIINE